MRAASNSAGQRSPRTQNGGFSLLEVLCAVLILAVVLVGLTQGLTTALHSSKDSELQTSATLFASGQIETLRAEGGLVDGDTAGSCGPGLSQYKWQQSIAPTGISGLHEISVSVQHASSGKTICELKTLLFEVPNDSLAGSGPSRDPRSKMKNRRL